MRKFLISKNSDSLLIFFTGWGCDEYEFEHLSSDKDVLLLYDYKDLNLYFDFSKYNKIDLISFSAGVFVASIFNFDFKINTAVAISGNPYLFDEKFGLSTKIQDILYNVTEESADDFAKNFLVKTDEEYERFRPSQRSIESCKEEFDSLKHIYQEQKQNIKDIFDYALVGEDDPIFDVKAQKEFYGEKLRIIGNCRHNLFFRITKYEEIFQI